MPRSLEQRQEYQFNCALWRCIRRTRDFRSYRGHEQSVRHCVGRRGQRDLSRRATGRTITSSISSRRAITSGRQARFRVHDSDWLDHRPWPSKDGVLRIAFLDTDAFPLQFRERIAVGNIHAAAINMDRLQRDGATYLAKVKPIFSPRRCLVHAGGN